MKIFTTHQTAFLDSYTIAHEPVSSIDLMERAAKELFKKIVEKFSTQHPILILAGQGNNGGDALALARMLLKADYDVNVILINLNKLSSDCETNREKLLYLYPSNFTEISNVFIPPNISKNTIIIDGLFGSGLSRPLAGVFADAVNWMNSLENLKVVIDIPSGLYGEENIDINKPIVKADYTFTFQFPKLSFLVSDYAQFVGEWEVLDIKIHQDAIENCSSNRFYLQLNDIKKIIKQRLKFSNKGTYGHLLFVGGSKGMGGAAVLASKAAMRSGAGLVSVHSAASNRIIVQSCVPEVIFCADKNDDFITEFQAIDTYSAIAIGPGIGLHTDTVEMMKTFCENIHKPLIIDADALNIISNNLLLLKHLPHNTIISPHPKEFDRLFGICANAYERMTKAIEKAKEYQLIIILKGANTLIAMPNGEMFFNSTGNSGMATAGTGDVLTGIVGSLLAQAYSPENAAKIGVYIHGLAGDLALKKQSKESLIASDIIENLGDAFKLL